MKGGKIVGTGSRKYKDEIRESIDKYFVDYVSNVDLESDSFKQDYLKYAQDDYNYNAERAIYSAINHSLKDLWNGNSNKLYQNVTLKQVNDWLLNPVTYNQEIRELSKYWVGKKGIVNRACNLYRNLPELLSKRKMVTLSTDKIDPDIHDEVLNRIKKFDLYVNKNILIRDILYGTVVNGTTIGYIHNNNGTNRYVSLLDLDYYYPHHMYNGTWVIRTDLYKFSMAYGGRPKDIDLPVTFGLSNEDLSPDVLLDSQPKEVQEAYLSFKSKPSDSTRFFDLSIDRTFVIKTPSERSDRYGLPIVAPAFEDLLHKEAIRQAENAVLDRIINVLLKVSMGTEDYKPQLQERRTAVKELRNQLYAKEKEGLKFLGIPRWVDIGTIDTSAQLFDKKHYESVDTDIRVALGVDGLISGAESTSSYAGTVTSMELFSSNYYAILEQIAENLFNYQYDRLSQGADIFFRREFIRVLKVNDLERLKVLEKLSDKGGSVTHLLESVGIDSDEYFKQTMYEKDELQLQENWLPFKTSHTMTDDGDSGGQPNSESDSDGQAGAPSKGKEDTSNNNVPRP